MSEEAIHIIGARTHNLKNISVDIPRNKLVVITGVSGSGKSSLAFDTLYAEGQRRYVESLSAYARQFLGRIQKPDVERIDGIPPAIAIQQKVTSRNPRSTVGTVTEIYDYLKLLFARIGQTISPISGQPVKRHTVQDVVKCMEQQTLGSKVLLLAPITATADSLTDQLSLWQQQGFSRLYRLYDDMSGEILRISPSITMGSGQLYLLVDRLLTDGDVATSNRFADSVQAAFYEGKGACMIMVSNAESSTPQQYIFSERFEADGLTFIEPTEHLFDYNSPLGACPSCGGFGQIIGIDPDLVIPDKSLSIYDNAIACWRGEKMGEWNNALIYAADKFNFPIHTPYYALTEDEKMLLWKGNEYFHGLNDFFAELESKQYTKIQYRVMLARYKGKALCPECMGHRLRKEAEWVKVGGRSISELTHMSIRDLGKWFDQVQFNPYEEQTVSQLLTEIKSRIHFMEDVGLNYLTIDRPSNSLSGGESQRISLAKSLGSSLVGSLYVLDEPSIGLHPRDTAQLIAVLHQLRDIGNTIVVVEHDEDIQLAADYWIEIGPKAGRNGGEVVYQGTPKDLHYHYDVPTQRRLWNNYIEVVGAVENNLKNLNVKFPLNVLTVVTGVSGSGKSSLVSKVLYPALKKYVGGTADRSGSYSNLRGSLHLIQNVEFVDQNPISKSSRSNPVTYLKAYDEIRRLYAEQALSKQLGLTPAHFSFNTTGGRCEVCQGEGTITIEMQFMADITMVCDHCHGKRFKQDILDVTYRDKNIYDILEMTVNQAIDFFAEDVANDKIVARLKPLQDVGLGYIKLGQTGSTLSGGESQRVKLASFLSQENASPTLFIFDEPTTGLHHKDIDILLKALNALISRGHSVLVIEHNPAIILASDYVIDLGPEGGNAGGNIVGEGTPEQIMQIKESYTGQALNKIIQLNQ